MTSAVTDRDTAAPVAAGTEPPPDLRRLWRSVRLPLLVAALLLVVLVGSAVLSAAGNIRPLDPRDASPQGARALAVLLGDRGVRVTPEPDVAAAVAGAGSRTTVVVPLPAALPRTDLAALGASPASLVVVGPDDGDLQALGLPVQRTGTTSIGQRLPDCALPAATTAGDADLGGAVYSTPAGGVGCYPAGGDPTLVVFPDNGRTVTILGAPDPLLNDRLAHRGNAALALGLLGGGDEVRWLLPRPPTAAPPPGEQRSLLSLLPGRLVWAGVELLVAVVLLALWRARRLGPVVAEPLPVVVRAAEAVEGRARLYRATGSRALAAEQLRAATRDRLAGVLGLPADPPATALCAAVGARIARNPGEVAALLYGAGPGDPPDDAGLVRLASALDALAADVRRS